MSFQASAKNILLEVLAILGSDKTSEAYEILKTAASMSGYSSWQLCASDERFKSTAKSLALLQVNGFPISYVEGEKEFMGLKIKLKPGVFMPRNETELLAEFSISKIKSCFNLKRKLRIVDIGTGTGAIALALANAFKEGEVLGIDINPQAVELAALNAEINAIRNARFKNIDFKSFLNSRDAEVKPFDVVISNPPYVGEFEKIFLPPSVRFFEPDEALYGGKIGFEFYKLLFSGLPKLLRKGGLFFFEIGFNQKEAVCKVAEKFGLKISFYQDYSGIDRIVFGEYV